MSIIKAIYRQAQAASIRRLMRRARKVRGLSPDLKAVIKEYRNRPGCREYADRLNEIAYPPLFG